MESPIGTIVAFGGEFTPENVEMLEGMGWLPCDGRSLRHTVNGVPTQFNDLFNVIRESFGEGYEPNGTTKTGDFNIPDCRGRFLRGVSQGTGLDPDAGNREAMRHGGNTNDRVGSIQSDIFASHSHSGSGTTQSSRLFLSGNRADCELKDGMSAGGAFGDGGASGITRGGSGVSVSITPTGGNETRPKNINVGYIIKFVKDV